VTLTIFASIDTKPTELTVTALVRGRFCELAAGTRAEAPRLFTLGLFSVIDALMDASIAEVLAKIPFPDDMREALICRCGPMGELIEAVTAIESGEFERAESIVPDAGRLYLEAVSWSTDVSRELFDAAGAAA